MLGQGFIIDTNIGKPSRTLWHELPNADYRLVIAGGGTRNVTSMARRHGIVTVLIDDKRPPTGRIHLTPKDVATDSGAFPNMIELALKFPNMLGSYFPATKPFDKPGDKIKAALNSDNPGGSMTHALGTLDQFISYYWPSLDESTIQEIAKYFFFEEEVRIGFLP